MPATFLIILDNELHIGFTTRSLLLKLLEEGDISELSDNFLKELLNMLSSLRDELLDCAQFLNFDLRETALFSQVEFFVRRYSVLKVRIIIYNHVL